MLDLAIKYKDSDDSSDLCETFLGVGTNINTETFIERKQAKLLKEEQFPILKLGQNY